jgi:predicted permease
MENFLVCLNAILPVFLTLGVGVLARCAGIIRESEVPRMNAVAFKVFMPLMCFYNIYSSDLSSSVRPSLMLYSALAVLGVYLLSWLLGRRFVRELPQRGVVIQGLYRSNFLILGFPVVTSLLPEEDAGVVAVLAAVVVPLFNILAVLTLESCSGEKRGRATLLLDCLKNPLVLGSAAGVLALLLGLRLPVGVEHAVRDLSRVASPLMLFLLVAFLRFSSFRGQAARLVSVCLGRLLVFPALALTGAALLGFRGMEFAALIAAFASPTAVASFTMAEQMGGDAELAGNIVVVTSLFCSLTMFLWCYLFKSLGMF